MKVIINVSMKFFILKRAAYGFTYLKIVKKKHLLILDRANCEK